jgi:translation initiation factor 2 subunit 1
MVDKFGTLYSTFEHCAANENALEENDLSGDWTKVFYEVAKENVTPPFVQISGILELKCPAPDGVDWIKKAIMKGTAQAETKVRVQYVGAPRYRVVISAPDYKVAEEDLRQVTDAMIEEIKSCGGEGAFHRDAK